MKIAAERIGTGLKVFIEGSNWKKALEPFNKEIVKLRLVVYYIEGKPIFHDAVSREDPDTHLSLMFCRNDLTVADFNNKLGKAGYGEPYEVRLGNGKFDLKKVFPCAYALTFHNYISNAAFLGWLGSLARPETDLLLKTLMTQDRYFGAGFPQSSVFCSIDEFMDQRFEIWQEEAVKEFEEALANGKAHCPGCNI
jgi:hypothetical protein